MFVFVVCPSRGLPNYIKTKYFPFAFTLNKTFLKSKKRSATGLPASFFA